MKKVWRATEAALTIILVLVAGVLGGAWYFARSSLPAYGAALTVGGLQDQVTIYRDSYGVPHIFAKNTHDLFFAQGFVQAQDRLWEMDLSRRAVQGRLAEIFGPDYVDADYFFRTIGFFRAGEAAAAAYPPEVVAITQAYSDGINAYIKQGSGKLPIEFSILGYEPDPWTPADSAAIGKYMAWILGGNMESELFHQAVVDKLGPEKAAELFPVYPDDGPIITVTPYEGFKTAEAGRAGPGQAPAAAAGFSGQRTPGDVAGLVRLMDLVEDARLGFEPGDASGLGSNNWVVAGKYTASGKPLLANDMHLEIKAPSIWYQNHLVAPGINVTGVIFPGDPGVVVGHNERIAWGVTNLGPDVQDLYIEKPNPENPHEFEYNGIWEPAKVYEEKIKVKGQAEPVVKEVVVTRHGPIISGVFSGKEEDEKISTPLALRWTALDQSDELSALLGFDTASNWEDFKKALEHFKVPAQNFVFADTDGNIAYRGNGLIPIRKAGNGLLPVPGWNSDYEWIGYIPWNELPTLYNPPSGIIVTANNRSPGPGYPYFISSSWSAPYRAASIWQELRGRDGLTPQDMQAIQNDTKNLQAARLLAALKAALDGPSASFSPVEREAYDILTAWASSDPRDLASEPGPAIYHTFYLQALKATFADELGEKLYDKFLGAGSPVNTFDAMVLAGKSDWFDNVTTSDKVETMSDTLAASFKAAVAELERRLGGKPKSWEWGKLHTVTFDHPMGAVAFLRPFFNEGPFPTGGSGVTAGAKGFSLKHPFEVTTGAPWRFVADLSDLAHSFDVEAIGASGQPFSPHYADQMDMWLKGQYKVMLFDRADIDTARGTQVTTLCPGQ